MLSGVPVSFGENVQYFKKHGCWQPRGFVCYNCFITTDRYVIIL